uniref:(northern house mosquito) hypothetical protein n=1 Tax=Culex pipiens TaxID=7175 RepID=A0A8D8GA36_CULPI
MMANHLTDSMYFFLLSFSRSGLQIDQKRVRPNRKKKYVKILPSSAIHTQHPHTHPYAPDTLIHSNRHNTVYVARLIHKNAQIRTHKQFTNSSSRRIRREVSPLGRTCPNRLEHWAT